MKQYILIFAACSLLLCCHHKHEPEEEPEPDPRVLFYLPCVVCEEEWPPEEPTCQCDLVWDYPIKPGTDEWEQFRFNKTHQEMVNMLQIPEEIVFSLSTEDLAEICFHHPHFMGLIAGGSSFVLNFDRFLSEFNGVRELFKREDVLKVLLKRHRCAMMKLKYEFETLSEKQRAEMFLGSVFPLEVLLGFCQSQNKEDYIEILQHLICGGVIQAKTRGSVFNPNLFSLAHIIIKIDEQNIEKFTWGEGNSVFKLGNVIDNQTPQLILDLSCQYIAN